MTRPACRAVFLLVALGLSFLQPAFSQTSNAQVTGLVQDPTEGAIPAATVKATNTATNVVYEAQTNSAGVYMLTQLIPGVYNITVTAAGFAEAAQTGIPLRTGDRLSLNVKLTLGSVATQVTVGAEAPMLTTDDASGGNVLDNGMITSLPQLRRSTLDLTNVSPDVAGGGPPVPGGWDLGIAVSGNSYSLAGGQQNGTVITVDGAVMQEAEGNAVNRAVPAPDAVNEFRIQTGVLTADVGRYSGGVITIASQSGTNRLHGRLFEYFRNQAMNSRSWSNNSLGVTTKNPFHQNNYGVSLGGPLTIPKVYSGKDRTFYFFAWEGERYVTGSLSQSSVPTELERQGNFSQSIIGQTGGRPVYARIFDPFSGYEDAAGNWIRPEFPNATIPISQQSKVFQRYLKLWPIPNHAPNANTSNASNYWSQTRNTIPVDRHTLKLDHNFTAGHRTNIRLSRYRMTNLTTAPYFHGQVTSTTDHDWSGSLQHTWVPSATSIVDIRIGFSYAKLYSVTGAEADPDIDTSTWGFDPVLVNSGLMMLRSVPPPVSTGGRTFGGYTGVGGYNDDQISQNNVNGSISFTKILGRHSFKAGYQHFFSIYREDGGERTGIDRLMPGGGSSQFWNSNNMTGHPLAELLMGSSSVSNWGYWNITPYSHSDAAFLTDDWKVTTRLTIQAGLRWDRDGGKSLKYPRTGQTFDVGAKNVLTPNANWSWSQVVARVPALANYPQPGWLVNGVNGRVSLMGTPEYSRTSFYSTNWKNFQPRLGISYALNPRTVVHAGAGIIYQGLNGLNASNGSFYYGTPNLVQVNTLDDKHWVSELGTDHGLGMFPLQSDGSHLGFIPPIKTNKDFWYATLGSCVSPTGVCASLPQQMDSPAEYMWTASVQRQVSKSWVLTAEYTGIRGIHLLTNVDRFKYTNVAPDYYGLGAALRTQVPNPFLGQSQTFLKQTTMQLASLLSPMPQYSNATPEMVTWGRQRSNFLNLQAQSRNYHGLSLLASYAIRKTLTNTSGKDYRHYGIMKSQGALQNPNDMNEAYAVAPYEVPQTLMLNYSYELPIGRGKAFLGSPSGLGGKILNAVVSGWGLAGYSTWVPKGTPVFAPTVSGSTTVPGSSVRWSVQPGANYLNPNVDYGAAIVVQGKFVYSNPERVFNKDAFVRTPNYTFGNIPVVFPNVRTPGSFGTDATLMKNFYLSENRQRYVNFRVEALNFFNHPNFGGIVTNPDSATFGGISGKSGMRTMQLGLRIFF